ncbi:MAG TPA: AgmX/PglI C-terminal domain-containing protein, partial [Polyangiaceae bacterium LLY-WYZ-15_(1-7)]|nr:AgmX/PglI C-terminal domain-containing protein [Polyangiaceae bacterium LLY-WYZ-15_(1-7)]
TALELLRDARQQLNAPYEDVRNDAARAVESLEQRIDDIGEAIRACLPRTSRLEPRTVVQEPTGTEARVERENDATRDVERDARLGEYVRVVVGERVDGMGQLSAGAVRSMVRGVSSRLERCYGELVERGALERGTLILTFTIDERGRPRRVTIDQQQVGDTRFARCVERAGRRLRASTPPSGGEVRYSYTLRFGP